MVDVADQRRVKQRFRLGPEGVPALALAFCVGDRGRHNLQNILFRMDVGERIVLHGLLEINRVQNLDSIPAVLE